MLPPPVPYILIMLAYCTYQCIPGPPMTTPRPIQHSLQEILKFLIKAFRIFRLILINQTDMARNIIHDLTHDILGCLTIYNITNIAWSKLRLEYF